MNDDDVTLETAVALSRAHLESLFPRNCSKCGRLFPSLADYLRNTIHVDAPISYDAVSAEVPAVPVGTMSFANCACGTTLSLGSEGMPVETIVRLMVWARAEIERRGVTIRDVLIELRDEIDRCVLADAERSNDAR
jgi:hypothetical protein